MRHFKYAFGRLMHLEHLFVSFPGDYGLFIQDLGRVIETSRQVCRLIRIVFRVKFFLFGFVFILGWVEKDVLLRFRCRPTLPELLNGKLLNFFGYVLTFRYE